MHRVSEHSQVGEPTENTDAVGSGCVLGLRPTI